jgi:hypothetical protein
MHWSLNEDGASGMQLSPACRIGWHENETGEQWSPSSIQHTAVLAGGMSR